MDRSSGSQCVGSRLPPTRPLVGSPYVDSLVELLAADADRLDDSALSSWRCSMSSLSV